MDSYRMLASRIVETEMRVMVQVQELIRGAKNAMSLAKALDKVKELVRVPSISRYGADEGLPVLREALIRKLRQENNLHRSSVIVTAGANQAFVNLVRTLCDVGDSVVMFAPYYFNAYMSFQMRGVAKILVGQVAYPTEVEGLATQLLKVQDNIPICTSIILQRLAFHSLEVGPEWVLERVKDFVKNQERVVEAISPLGEVVVQGGEGAIYLWETLPEKYVDDVKVVQWLANRHRVVVILGTACWSPGHLRISFGGLIEDDSRAAAKRLKRGLEELVKGGMVQ